MAFLDKKDLKQLYTDSKTEARVWREDYSSYERLADNGLMEGLDPNLPEVNDGSLAASLFKLPKRIVNSKLSGTVTVTNRDEAWMGELANIMWRNEIVPYANSQAPFHRKWKDAVRKAAIYGSVPLITLFVDTDGKRHADFIVGQPQDVTLEPGKVSDYDSDVHFWDVYYTKLQLDNMIEQAEKENKEAAEELKEYNELQAVYKEAKKENPEIEDPEMEAPAPYNDWNIPGLKKVKDSKQDEEGRDGNDQPRTTPSNQAVQKKGYKFCIAVQRGEGAPFYMYHKATDTTVRTWSNPDPTGDSCIHFLYCYQDFINPYGIGIVKLAGGTQNVLDYMRQADILATQLGLRPPIEVNGDADSVDIDSLVYSQDAIWFTGQAKVERKELANGVYSQLPDRMAMYKTSLNQMIPTGDTSIASGSGDPQYSKTPAGVKFQGAQLSIDDEDFKDNLYMTYKAVSKSMINTQFANMEGSDIYKLSDDERDILIKAGFDWPESPDGEMSNELEVIWDTVRGRFDFEVNPEQDKAKEDEVKLDGLMKVAELIASDPNLPQDLQEANKKLNKGELYSEIIQLTSDNDKILTDIGPEEESAEGEVDLTTGQPVQAPPVGPDGQPVPPQQPQVDPQSEERRKEEQHMMDMESKKQAMDMKAEKHSVSAQPKQPTPPVGEVPPAEAQGVTPEEMQANVEAVMQEYGVDENDALAALAAEHQGFPMEDIIAVLKDRQGASV